jgi:hypothetical protein
MSDADIPPPDSVRRQIRHNLRLADLGSCRCMTKSPEPAQHAETCPHRLIREALALFDQVDGGPAWKALQALTNPYNERDHGQNWHVSAHAWEAAIITAMRTVDGHLGFPGELPAILREAAEILAGTRPLREPIIDELHGFAAMLAEVGK